MKVFNIVTILLTLASLAHAELGPGDYEFTLFNRSYRLHVPPQLRVGIPAPVVFAFHGGGGSALQFMRDENLAAKSDQAGYVLVLPNGTPNYDVISQLTARRANLLARQARNETNRDLTVRSLWLAPRRFTRLKFAMLGVYDERLATLEQLLAIVTMRLNAAPHHLTWNAGACCGYAAKAQIDDQSFVRLVLADVQRKVTVDTRRIYATGISNGAMLAHRLGCEMSDVFAAIASVEGVSAQHNYQKAGNPETYACRPRRPVPVLMIHGRKDNCVRFEGGNGGCFEHEFREAVVTTLTTWSRVNGCSSPSSLTPIPALTHGEAKAFTNLSCGARAEISLWALDNGSHDWPGSPTPGIVHSWFPSDYPGTDPMPSRDLSASDATWSFFEKHPMPLLPLVADFDGDGKSDLALFDPWTSTFFLYQGKAGAKKVQFGQGQLAYGNPIPIAGDFDGDGRADIGVFQTKEATFFLLQSSAGFRTFQFGAGELTGAHPQPLVGDFDGDGRADVGVFQPWDSTFALWKSREGFEAFQFGAGNNAGWYPLPLVGDFDGDRRADVAVFQQWDSMFYLRESRDGFRQRQFGQGIGANGFPIPLVGDFDADRATDLLVYQPWTSQFAGSSVALPHAFALFFGPAGAFPTPLVGDYDGDGMGDLTAFDQRANAYYFRLTVSGQGIPLVLGGTVPY